MPSPGPNRDPLLLAQLEFEHDQFSRAQPRSLGERGLARAGHRRVGRPGDECRTGEQPANHSQDRECYDEATPRRWDPSGSKPQRCERPIFHIKMTFLHEGRSGSEGHRSPWSERTTLIGGASLVTLLATRKRTVKRRSAGRSASAQGTSVAADRTNSGLPLEILSAPRTLDSDEYLKKLGMPGEPPYTRGIRATMYRGRLWTMRQYAGFGTAKETNRRFKYLIAQGNEGLSVAFDLPTQMGYDSDAPLARGEVGRVGVAISTLEDMGVLFEGLPLDRVSTSMTINATAPILLALYIAVAESHGISRKVLRGTVQNDILKEYIARSTYIYPPAPSMRLALDVIEFCTKEVPRWNAISVSGYHIREAGATAVQEIAFTLANGTAYLDAAVARGLDVDAIAPQISFFFNAHIDLLEEVAKFRAARVGGRLSDSPSRSARWHAEGDRLGLGAGPGRRLRIPVSNGARARREDRRRRERVHGGGRGHPGAQDESEVGRRASPCPRDLPEKQRPESGRAKPRSSRCGRPRGGEHDARDPGRHAGQGDARGDQRRA